MSGPDRIFYSIQWSISLPRKRRVGKESFYRKFDEITFPTVGDQGSQGQMKKLAARMNFFAANFGDGRAFVDCSMRWVGHSRIVYFDDCSGWLNARIPTLNGAILRYAEGKSRACAAPEESPWGFR